MDLRVPGVGESLGNVYYSNMGGISGFVLYAQAGGPTGIHGSSCYNYNGNLCYTFEASVSIS